MIEGADASAERVLPPSPSENLFCPRAPAPDLKPIRSIDSNAACVRYYVDAAISELRLDTALILLLSVAAVSISADVLSRGLRHRLRIARFQHAYPLIVDCQLRLPAELNRRKFNASQAFL
jgi:hypothetical protein